jgi:hypothetical protein
VEESCQAAFPPEAMFPDLPTEALRADDLSLANGCRLQAGSLFGRSRSANDKIGNRHV